MNRQWDFVRFPLGPPAFYLSGMWRRKPRSQFDVEYFAEIRRCIGMPDAAGEAALLEPS